MVDTLWKNAIPDWLVPWIAETQANDVSCRWSLFAFSRGAAWGAIVAADVRLTFHRVLLVALYVLPSMDCEREKRKLIVMLSQGEHRFCIAFGSADHWKSDISIQAIQRTCRNITFEGLGHAASLSKAVEVLWEGLFFHANAIR